MAIFCLLRLCCESLGLEGGLAGRLLGEVSAMAATLGSVITQILSSPSTGPLPSEILSLLLLGASWFWWKESRVLEICSHQ